MCADAPVDQPLVDAFEISPAGPTVGPEMRPAEGVVDETKGTRRFYRVPVGHGALSAEGAKVRSTFELPAGCYATTVIRELLKTE